MLICAARRQGRCACWDLKFLPRCIGVHQINRNRLLFFYKAVTAFPCDGRVQPSEVLPGAHPWLPATHGSAGPGAGMAAAAYLPAVSAPLDVG